MNELLKFTPILKPVIWGGFRLASYKGIRFPDKPIGESWDLSPLEGMESVVAEGIYKGRSLSSLVEEYPVDILGDRVARLYGNKFPLLLKFLDTADNLSIQVHPDNEMARERHNCSGKSEMWYSVAPEPGSYLYAGFCTNLNAAQFMEILQQNRIIENLRKYYTHRGDVLFLPAGRIHSIGAGNLLFEVQQASDITYRVYDYDRCDSNGRARELHIEEGLQALNFEVCSDEDIKNVQSRVGETRPLARCKFFVAAITGFDGSTEFRPESRDSFTTLTAVSGSMMVTGPSNSLSLNQGETILVPASVQSVVIEGTGEVISVNVP